MNPNAHITAHGFVTELTETSKAGLGNLNAKVYKPFVSKQLIATIELDANGQTVQIELDEGNVAGIQAGDFVDVTITARKDKK